MKLVHHQLITLKKYFVQFKLIRLILYYFFLFILILRSFFCKERSVFFITWCIPFITSFFVLLHNLYPSIFSAFSASYFFIWLGAQLIILDHIGNYVVTSMDAPDAILSTTVLTKLKNAKPFIARFVSFQALLLGKTSMTATGRASLIAGVFTGGVWLYNSHLDRQAADRRATATREATDQRASADREATDQRAAADRRAADQRAATDRETSYKYKAWKFEQKRWETQHADWQKRKKGPEPVKPGPFNPTK